MEFDQYVEGINWEPWSNPIERRSPILHGDTAVLSKKYCGTLY
jgi:hypothetical protein